MPNNNQWTINASGTTGGNDKSDLVGCHLKENAAGNGYDFTEPNGTVLSSTTGSTLPTPTFDFPQFYWADNGFNWNISVTTLTGGASNNKAEGTWTNNDSSITAEQDGTFTAQAGSTVGDDAEEDAASASA